MYLLQSDLSALLISDYPAVMFLASALRSGHHPCENMTRLGWTVRGNVSIVARSLHDVVAVQKMPE